MRYRTWTHKGFTLIELLLVITILAFIAAIVVPRMQGVDDDARLTVSISNISDISRTMETFGALHDGKYPDGWDSLLDSTATTNVYPGDGTSENRGVEGSWLAPSAITAAELTSMELVSSNMTGTGATGALVTVYHHDPTETDATTSADGTTADEIAASDYLAFVDVTTTGGADVYAAFNLDPATTDYRVLALGVGTQCTMIGTSSGGLSAPPYVDDPAPNAINYYRRPVALFKVFADGTTKAQFVGIVTSFGTSQGEIRSELN